MRKKINKKVEASILLGIIFLIVLSFASASSSYTRSTFSYGSNFGTSSTSWNLDSNVCEKGTDFLVQITPFGCDPTVVRSDLLEEQNVPVFCQLGATQINPLIKVNSIEKIGSFSVTGDSANYISGVGFHPAQAALGTNTNLNSPVLNNIGYTVVVLKKQPNASAMPDYITGNISAKLEYDLEDAYGIGKGTFYLPVLDDSEWENSKNQYGFWSKRGYFRAESIGDNKAIIGIYSGNNQKISTVNLEKGKTSNVVYLPGFDCLAGLKLTLNSLEDPTTRARLNIDGQIVEVGEREEFLDNSCRVNDVSKKGLSQYVSGYCKTDDGQKNFDLAINPKVDVTICDEAGTNCEDKSFGIGDQMYQDSSSKRYVYLGYLGEDDSGTKFIVPVLSTAKTKTEFLNSLDSTILDRIVRWSLDSKKGLTVVDAIKNSFGILVSYGKAVVTGSQYADLIYEGQSDVEIEFPLAENLETYIKLGKLAKSIVGLEENWNAPTYTQNRISFTGLSAGANIDLEGDLKDYYENATSDFDKVLNSYGSEILEDKYQFGSFEVGNSFGEEALFNKILLAQKLEQKKLVVKLCSDFKSKYPNSEKLISSICDNELGLSSDSPSIVQFSINGKVKTISFETITQPDYEDYGARIKLSGTEDGIFDGDNYQLELGDRESLSENEWFELREIKENSVVIYASTNPDSNLKSTSGLHTIKLGGYEYFGPSNKYKIEIKEINVKKSAKVSLNPVVNNAGTEVNFSFKIGIEQRAIELSPEKTKRKIAELDEKIEDWGTKADKLESIVKGLKASCLGVGSFLTVKNFLQNGLLSSGKSIARQKVMKMKGGWNDNCTEKVKKKEYISLEDCFFENSDAIDRDVNTMHNVMNGMNDNFENLEKDITTTQFFGEDYVDTNALKKRYYPQVQDLLKSQSTFTCNGDTYSLGEGSVIYSSLDTSNPDYFNLGLGDAKDLELNLKLLGGNLDNSARDSLCTQFSEIENTYSKQTQLKSVAEKASTILNNAIASSYGDKDSIVGTYTGATAKEGNSYGFEKGKEFQLITYNNKEYYLQLEKSKGTKNQYVIDKIYNGNGNLLTADKELLEEKSSYTLQIYDETASEIMKKFKYFEGIDSGAYENVYSGSLGDTTKPVLRYYETEPYKGYPAIVPFDLKRGWYAQIKQQLPIASSVSAYDSSGRVMSFYVCNVWTNGREENGGGDDHCTQINLGTRQAYNQIEGLSENDAKKLVDCAVSAISQAQKIKNPSGKVSLKTDCGGSISVYVGSPAVDLPDVACTDLMSPKDCQLLFNVCDPVICPSSRCDFGGKFPVKDVIQSGIIGSTLLCLPNLKEGIYIPVCLSGIYSGIRGLVSVYENHRDCLQESLDRGEMVGVCDEIYSIYLCEFFWKQSTILAKLAIPKLLEVVTGTGSAHGGGEYLGISEAWKNAENSVDFFIQYYASDATSAFKAKVTEGIGDAVCQNSLSAVYTDGTSVLESLTNPDSPPQFHGYFEETSFTTATNPPLSYYKVFYHVYAGEESRAYFQVYLKGDSSSYYQDAGTNYPVASGYITTGDYASETKDFTAPSGYTELCINVNGQEKCGFKEVSTSFAVDYVTDSYVASYANQTDVTTEDECVSGEVNLAQALTLTSLNLQSSVEDIIDPQIYDLGIIRICATGNPGTNSDGEIGSDKARWIDVGYCGDKNLRCWLDKESVKDAIELIGIENETLESQTSHAIDVLMAEGDYLTSNQFIEKLEELKSLNSKKRIEKINQFIDKLFYSNHKAETYTIRGISYATLAGDVYEIKKIDDALKSFFESVDVKEQQRETTSTATSPNLEDYPVEYENYIWNAVSDFGEDGVINEDLIKAIIKQESNWNQKAISVDGATGLMQLIEKRTNGAKVVGAIDDIKLSTGKCNHLCGYVYGGSDGGILGKTDAYGIYWSKNSNKGAESNIRLGTCYFDCLGDTSTGYGIVDLKKRIAAYNAGPTKVKSLCGNDDYSSCKNKLPTETQNYVEKVMAYYEDYSGISESGEIVLAQEGDVLKLSLSDYCYKFEYKLKQDGIIDSTLEEGENAGDYVEFNVTALLSNEKSKTMNVYAEVSCYDSVNNVVWYDKKSDLVLIFYPNLVSCEDCGEGATNGCDEEECKQITELSEKNCEFKMTSNLFWKKYGKCTEKTKTSYNLNDVDYAIEQINKYLKNKDIGNVDYSDNEEVKKFIDGLHSKGILTDSQYEDIIGEKWYNGEDDLEWVKEKLIENKVALDESSAEETSGSSDFIDKTGEILDGAVKSLSDFTKGLSRSFDEKELKTINSADECSDCGGSLIDSNICDKEECQAIGSNLKSNCVFIEQGIDKCVEIKRCTDCEDKLNSLFGRNKCDTTTCNSIGENLEGVACIYDGERALDAGVNFRSACYDADECSDCGDGIGNSCDRAECYQISNQIGGVVCFPTNDEQDGECRKTTSCKGCTNILGEECGVEECLSIKEVLSEDKDCVLNSESICEEISIIDLKKLEKAISDIDLFNDELKYRNNLVKPFVDKLYEDKIITEEEYDEINGGWFGIGQSTVKEIKEVLNNHWELYKVYQKQRKKYPISN